MTMLPPGSTIGILGGGQLGKMLAVAAAEMGYRCHIYAPEENSVAAEVAAEFTCADYDDVAALSAFADSCDVITYEFENVPVAPLRVIEEGATIRPNIRALEIAQARANKTLDTQVSRTREQQAAVSAAAQKAGAEIQALGVAWRAQDPARFNAVLPAIADKIKELERTVAPEFLPQAIELAYLKHPYTPTPAAAPKAPVGDPLAAGPSGGAAVVQEPKSALEAMQAGMGWR